jgi:hypothetical protein
MDASNNYKKELFRRVNEVLHYVWDPIGVCLEPNARDEYDTYVPRVYALLQDGADAAAIVSYLDSVATDRMGLGPNAAQSLVVAQCLLAWRARLSRKFASQPTTGE